jgi:ferritin-like metal-binding protein YciE
MTNAQTLRGLLVDELRDLYNAERQLTKALPKMARAASSDDLREAFEAHLSETEHHVQRLDTVFETLDEAPRGKRCAGMAGIIEEGSDLMGEDFDGAVLDAGLIASAQRAEHYEIGAYGSVIAWAKALGLDEVADTLHETLEEEKAADEKLNALAEGAINVEAASGGNGEAARMGNGRAMKNGRTRGSQNARSAGNSRGGAASARPNGRNSRGRTGGRARN